MNWLIGHLVGDYLLQNDWMALNKKKAVLPCLVHCLLYTLAIWAFTGWGLFPLSFVFLSHFAQDHTTFITKLMNANGQRQFAAGPCAPWSIIVVDNVLHLLVLFVLERGLNGQTMLPCGVL